MIFVCLRQKLSRRDVENIKKFPMTEVTLSEDEFLVVAILEVESLEGLGEVDWCVVSALTQCADSLTTSKRG
jgi:hypothetical protein